MAGGLHNWPTNQGDIAPASDINDSIAVQFLYGPLISGICAGITILIAAIALCECICRRRMFPKIENIEGDDKQETTATSNKTSSFDIEEGKWVEIVKFLKHFTVCIVDMVDWWRSDKD